jgi:hypothetical protein
MITPSFALTATERVLPRMALDFTTASLDSRVTFTRTGATATRVNASGLIAYVAANTARFDFDPTTLVCKGLLIEEARTNIVIQSDALNSGAYATSNATVGTNAVVSPDGTLNAETVTTGASGTGQIFGVSALLPVTPATDYTVSFYAKNISATYVVYGVLKVTPTAAWIVDIANPANNYVSQINSSTWTRITFSFNSGTATSINLYMAANLPATQSLSIWGVQLEAGAFATSYIRTTGSQVTRTPDVAVMTSTNFSSWYTATTGAAVVWAIPQTATGTRPLIQFDDTTALEIITLRGNVADPEMYIVDAVAQAQIDTGTIVANTAYKLSGAWHTNNCAAAKDGGSVGTDVAATIPTPTQLRIGSDGTNYASAWVQKILYYPQRLINAEVQAISK